MSKEKIEQIISFYEEYVPVYIRVSGYYSKRKVVHDLSHVMEMLPQMREFNEEDRVPKLMRWLGFVQGALWDHGVYTLDELQEHNKPVS